MKKLGGILILILLGKMTVAQQTVSYTFQSEFEQAYSAFPRIPKGLLEGVAFAQTRIKHISGNQMSCIGIPAVSGVMGLTENGQGYFDNNLQLVSDLSGVSVSEIKSDPAQNIYAYASAFSYYLEQVPQRTISIQHCEQILQTLSEIPKDENPVNQYALSCFTYEVLGFMNDPERQTTYGMPQYNIDFISIYGEENFAVLSSANVTVDAGVISDPDGNQFSVQTKSLEYAPALWVATPSCNYSSRSGTAISAVTIHTIQGTYAGAISWAQNCSASVSYHYVARSSDGQITQMVYEADKAWHVGTENPYTIGIEHEGYVSDPAWYTEAMYIGSSNLVKDICNSGYGINPLRTFQGPATSGLNVLGGCVKIKGHQHYPNQTHTDPGINWNWEHYYQLLNSTTPVVTYTASSGTLYDSGGAGGNYGNDERKLYLIQPAGAVTVTLSFQSFNLENNWDYLYVYDGSSVTDPLIDVFTGSTLPANITSTGPEILIEFRSDCSTTASGWEINWSSLTGPVPGDVVAPTTLVSFPSTWKTTDWNATFNDVDNTGGSGVQYHLYQVIDYDGVEWRANQDHGFFSDNFDLSIHPDWTLAAGNWSINSAVLNQADEANGNTNIYAPLNQDDHDVYLYNWGGRISGTGTNKRVGFHFMCDDPTLPNRGNSYFVWFREDDNKVQIYKVVSDAFTLMADVSYSINPNQWYDFKTLFDKNTGAIKVWINDVFVASWVDSSPYLTGNSVSFRSGNSVYDVNDFKVYHDRAGTELITVGPSGDVRYQNPDPVTSSAKIKSMVVDSSSNVSAIGYQFANVDWTVPANVSAINDGTGADIASTTSNTELSANWSPSSDAHSAIARYWYSIGTAPGLTDVVSWTDNWYDTTVTQSGLSLTYGSTYYFNVRAENGAGLLSGITSSNGQILDMPVNPPVADFNLMNTYVCSGTLVQILNSTTDATSYSWSVPGAIPPTSTDVNPYFEFPVSGTYEITLTADGPGGTDSEIQLINMEVLQPPVADFSQSSATVDLSYPFVTFSNNSSNANGYLWDFGDGVTSADNNPWHEFPGLGTFDIMLIAINGTCPNDTAWSTVTVIQTSGLTERENDLIIYPVPAHDQVYIRFAANLDEPLSIELTDMRGRVILSRQVTAVNGLIQLDLGSSVSAGTYTLKLLMSEGVITRQLSIE